VYKLHNEKYAVHSIFKDSVLSQVDEYTE